MKIEFKVEVEVGHVEVGYVEVGHLALGTPAGGYLELPATAACTGRRHETNVRMRSRFKVGQSELVEPPAPAITGEWN